MLVSLAINTVPHIQNRLKDARLFIQHTSPAQHDGNVSIGAEVSTFYRAIWAKQESSWPLGASRATKFIYQTQSIFNCSRRHRGHHKQGQFILQPLIFLIKHQQPAKSSSSSYCVSMMAWSMSLNTDCHKDRFFIHLEVLYDTSIQSSTIVAGRDFD